jgi:sialidase-1
MSIFVQQHLFTSGVGGYFRYRIPALVISASGTVLAFCEGRQFTGRDSDQIDLLLRRSFDSGQTFEEIQIVMRDEDWVCGNPAPVLDADTETIWLLFCKNRHDKVERDINQGLAERTVWVMSSSDDGATWTEPAEITADVKPSHWGWYATGPGHGIQLQNSSFANGRLLIPCNHSFTSPDPDIEMPYFSHVVVSDDHGKTWQLGGSLLEGTNECAAIEMANGRVYLNSRNAPWSLRERSNSIAADATRYNRAFAWSDDGGNSFSLVKHDPALLEPICQASICRFDQRRIIFTNPASHKRENLTARLSYDECQTWPVSRLIHAGSSQYSDLCVTGDGMILCFYERGEKAAYETLTIARFDIAWLEAGT